jgi:endonuclease III
VPHSSATLVRDALRFYERMIRTEEHAHFAWSESRRRFTPQGASAFLIGVMLDQGQKAERAWAGGHHLVREHFQDQSTVWEAIRKTSSDDVHRVCTTGFNGKSYASVYATNKFPKWLTAAAFLVEAEYQDDPRRIWNVKPSGVNLIYDRLVEFKGIGDALAKMAQFILVRNHGVAGGQVNQANMSIKPDILVRRVLFRTGTSGSEALAHSICTIEALPTSRPADVDAALWTIGRDYCLVTNPKCKLCPLRSRCTFAGEQRTDA